MSVAVVIQSCGQTIVAAVAEILYVSRLRDSQRAIIQKRGIKLGCQEYCAILELLEGVAMQIFYVQF